MALTGRQEKLLCLIVEHFIDTGEPVGSKFLSTIYGSSISSATIRNEMAALMQSGFIEQPHTSAGRIPSRSGYRFYISNLMKAYELSPSEQYGIYAKLATADGDPRRLVKTACSLLSDITDCIVCAQTPLTDGDYVSKLELVSVGTSSVLVIMKLSSGLIKSRVCRLEEPLDIDDAKLFYSITRNVFIGRTCSEISLSGMQSLCASLNDKLFLLLPLLTTVSELLKEASQTEIITSGTENLFTHKELSSELHRLPAFLSSETNLRKLLSVSGDKTDIRTGAETDIPELSGLGMLRSKYVINGTPAGSICLLGPERMDYPRIIPRLEFVTKTLGELLGAVSEN